MTGLSPLTEEQKDENFARKKREKFGGRKKGSVNKRTLEKLTAAEHEITAGLRGKKLAIDHMDEMIDYFRGLVAMHQPWNADGTRKEGKDDRLFFRCVDAFRGFLSLRAPYQSPTLSAVAIMPQNAQRTTVNVTILNDRGDTVYSDTPEPQGDSKLIEHDGGEEAA